MEKVEMFRADDGKIFETMRECVKYEQKGILREKIIDCKKAFDAYCDKYGDTYTKAGCKGCIFNTICDDFCEITNAIVMKEG